MADDLLTSVDKKVYEAAYTLVVQIDHHLTCGNQASGVATRHFRRLSDGVLLWTLGQVVEAILADDLTVGNGKNEANKQGNDLKNLGDMV